MGESYLTILMPVKKPNVESKIRVKDKVKDKGQAKMTREAGTPPLQAFFHLAHF
jgi:hypothetical protein